MENINLGQLYFFII